MRVGGIVSEVAATHYRVAGLSRYVKLGELIGLEIDNQVQLGEVVRIDSDGVTAKPFDSHIGAGLGLVAYRLPPKTIAPRSGLERPRASTRSAEPIDDGGPLRGGERGDVDGCRPAARDEAARASARRCRPACASSICSRRSASASASASSPGPASARSTLAVDARPRRGFDTVVIALVGERGREVREFLEETLVANRSRAVTVVSTGDESPMMRRLAPKTAMTIAEYFRDRGESVLLIVDFVTRYAHAARDVALAAGEPAVARGYAPSVFSDLPKLLERPVPATEGQGSITGIFSVLVDGDDHNEPVADTIRGTLDGHIVLDRDIADQGRYPAVNVLSLGLAARPERLDGGGARIWCAGCAP